MWRRLIAFALRLFGRGHWNPFLRALANQGRPSPVFFPPELVDQGLSIVLTGLTNTMAFQAHPSWALPWWAEQQVRPDSVSFIPTGVNILTVNLTHRNWTTLGLAGMAWKAMVDPCGMLTPKAYGPSWMPAVTLEGRTWVPSLLDAAQVRQSLRDGDPNQVATAYRIHPDLAWGSEAMAFRHGGRDWVRWTHTLAWAGAWPADLAFTLGLRPFNALTLGPVFRSRLRGRFWSVNRQAALLLPGEPDAAWFGRDRVDPLLAQPPPEPTQRGHSRSGWLGGAARWNLRLEPGRTWTLETFALIPAQDRRLRWQSLDSDGLGAAAEAQAAASDGLPAPLGLRLADPELQALVTALARRLPVFDNGRHFAPGAFFYNHSWLRDSAFLALAHDLWGLHGAVAAKEDAWMRTRTRGGDFRSHSGEWDGTGQTLYFWATHALTTGSLEVLARRWRSMGQGARWAARARRQERDPGSPHYGLLPAGLSAEHFGPNDHYFWDNFWCLAGLDRLRLALTLWNAAPRKARQLSDWLAVEADAYREALGRHVERLTAHHAGLLPSSPYRQPDAACIGTLAALGPLDLDLGPETEAWARANVAFLLDHWVRDSLFYQPIIHTGGNAYLTAQLARALMCQGDARWLGLLAGILAHASPTRTWPEAIHPHTGGGCMGDGDHGWPCAEVLSLVRQALVRDQAGHLLLLPNAPESWWASGPMGLTGAPTPAGSLTFSLVPRAPGGHVLAWERRRTPFQAPWPLMLVLPEGWRAEAGFEAARTPWGAPGLWLPEQGQLTLERTPAAAPATRGGTSPADVHWSATPPSRPGDNPA
jgi:hypothetical protein